MTKIGAVLLLSLSATPALAHDGGHLHPHGFETLPVMVGITAIIVALLVFVARSR